MRSLHNVIGTITTELDAHPFVNTVTYGNIFEVDLSKQTLFPLSHFIINDCTYNGSVITFSMSIICMAVYDKEDNEQYVLAEQLSVLTKVFEKLRRGDLRDEKYHLVGNPTMTPFKERFENDLVGWESTFTVEVPNEMGND